MIDNLVCLTEAVFKKYGFTVNLVKKFEGGNLQSLQYEPFLIIHENMDRSIAKHLDRQFKTIIDTITNICPICGYGNLFKDTLKIAGLPSLLLCPLCEAPYSNFSAIRAKYQKTVLLFYGYFRALREKDGLVPLIQTDKWEKARNMFKKGIEEGK